MTERVNEQADTSGSGAETLDPRYEAEANAAGGTARDAPNLVQELAEARQEAADANDRYLRARADMENYKKRIERTYADRARDSKKDLLRKLLGVKDNIERALQYGDNGTAGESIMEGVRLTQYQLDRLLETEGVHSIDAEGKPFDPRLEEAIQSVDDPDVADHTVVRVVQPGYTYQDEVLRPAQVIVSVHGQDQ